MRYRWPADTAFIQHVLTVEPQACALCQRTLHVCDHRFHRFFKYRDRRTRLGHGRNILGEPLPIAKPPGPGGSCPFGYKSSGSFCIPSQGARDAIPKPPNGVCPFGWLASGNACLRSGR